jgi:CubicO group peptidase (beta-lactamase class C family)
MTVAGTTRRQFMRQATVLLSGAALTGCSSSRSGGSMDGFLDDTVPDGASLTALAARGGKIVYCDGIGMANREDGIRAGRDTVYDIGSITKQFTAAAILKLEMAGELSTTDPLARFAPNDNRDITLHQLLTHTAGLVDALGDDYDVLSRDDMLAAALRATPQSAPGTAYSYSNVGYSILAAVVEKVSGVGYEEFLSTQLFAPAGMTRTGYVLPQWAPADVAVEYDGTGKALGRPNERPWAEDGPYWNLRGNGGILSTAPDMFRWHLALNGHDVLSEKAKRKLFTPYVREGDDDSFYGYGWVILDEDGRKVAWHNGGNGYSYAEIALLPDEGLMLFWATAAARKDGGWNLEDASLTQGIADRLRG